MAQRVRILGTGIRVDLHPDPETALLEVASAFAEHASPEDRAELARWRAGEVAFVRLTSFAEFDNGSVLGGVGKGHRKARTPFQSRSPRPRPCLASSTASTICSPTSASATCRYRVSTSTPLHVGSTLILPWPRT